MPSLAADVVIGATAPWLLPSQVSRFHTSRGGLREEGAIQQTEPAPCPTLWPSLGMNEPPVQDEAVRATAGLGGWPVQQSKQSLLARWDSWEAGPPYPALSSKKGKEPWLTQQLHPLGFPPPEAGPLPVVPAAASPPPPLPQE